MELNFEESFGDNLEGNFEEKFEENHEENLEEKFKEPYFEENLKLKRRYEINSEKTINFETRPGNSFLENKHLEVQNMDILHTLTLKSYMWKDTYALK